MKDKDVSLKVNAAIALGMIGMDDKDIVSGVAGLMALLGDSQAIVRYQAAMSLGRLGTDSKPAIPALLFALKDSMSWEIRKAAAFALSSAAEDRQNGPDMRAVNGLIGALGDISHQVRLETIIAFIVLGPPARGADKLNVERAIQAVIRNDKNKPVVIWARMALMRMDKISEEQILPIAKFLKAPEAYVRIHACRALGTLGKEAKGRVPDLIELLDDKDQLVLVWACWALGQMGDNAKRAVEPLSKLSRDKDKDETVKQAATEALNKITGAPANQAPAKDTKPGGK
jgi:HEAT repeat protein